MGKENLYIIFRYSNVGSIFETEVNSNLKKLKVGDATHYVIYKTDRDNICFDEDKDRWEIVHPEKAEIVKQKQKKIYVMKVLDANSLNDMLLDTNLKKLKMNGVKHYEIYKTDKNNFYPSFCIDDIEIGYSIINESEMEIITKK